MGLICQEPFRNGNEGKAKTHLNFIDGSFLSFVQLFRLIFFLSSFDQDSVFNSSIELKKRKMPFQRWTSNFSPLDREKKSCDTHSCAYLSPFLFLFYFRSFGSVSISTDTHIYKDTSNEGTSISTLVCAS